MEDMTPIVRSKILHGSPDDLRPFVFEDTYEIESLDGVDRLVIAAKADWTRLMLDLIRPGGSTYSAMYQVQSDDQDERIESGILSFEELESLIARFVDFIELLPWHNFWVYNFETARQLVLDEHNLIYAYGDLDHFAQALGDRGFRKASMELPFPHVHPHSGALANKESELILALKATR